MTHEEARDLRPGDIIVERFSATAADPSGLDIYVHALLYHVVIDTTGVLTLMLLHAEDCHNLLLGNSMIEPGFIVENAWSLPDLLSSCWNANDTL